ncbi:MAG: hypothetical protein A2233_05220 [Candidatus Kerfeldbacteria bacterium RIFOXYA2_FULL_38_24]|uniref:GtrA/DPMS transmembrane domain-containing protein n=1 Tax=Candidatus Kerfeldbacteria bacterium RIFOXYB2_FULL_38_14 TaxID=1798547 RepID=A0A1G2BGG6_9BACT|nr:MAG: hypothetical protein A2233_05220 [Candidatus Kerfeldbacteria bacterium RIFOXYA2_FULL_38_24]OGY88232.1 MAG: hypothetical protein A2319_03515 [Candidatus Kerfeldbacteria bacterium RIFOXYB2_FULL_38_14]
MKKITLFQLVRFATVGSANTILDALVYTGLTRGFDFFQVHYLLASTLAFLIAGLNSFIWNKHWTFKDGIKYSHRQLMRFYSASGTAFVLNQFFLWFLVGMQFNDIVAKICAGVMAGLVNFLIQKFWAFPVVKKNHSAYNTDKAT